MKSQTGSVFPSMNAQQLFDLLSSNPHQIQLIDVREPDERMLCHIGGLHAPLGMLETYLDGLAKDKMTIVYCKSGGRSAHACERLRDLGFGQVFNLEGGILGWIDTVDNQLTRY